MLSNTLFSAHPDQLLSIGKPVSDIIARILDDEYKVIPYSSQELSGRLAILSKMNMSGYWNASELTDEILKESWAVSNGIAYLDEDGYIFLLGRANDVINVGGKRYPRLKSRIQRLCIRALKSAAASLQKIQKVYIQNWRNKGNLKFAFDVFRY